MSILDFTDEDEIIKCPDVKSVAEKLTHLRNNPWAAIHTT